MQNKEQYETEISKIQLDEVSEEPIISCGNNIFNRNYYYQHEASKGLIGIDVEENVYLREGVICTLMKADEFLRLNGLCLFLRNGYRSTKLQRNATNNWKTVNTGNDDSKKRFSQSIHPPHASGGVSDLEIFDIKRNKCLHTKSKTINGLYPYQKLEIDDKDGEWVEIRKNIRLLHNLLTKPYILDEYEVFIQHPYEHWHFGTGDRHSKFFSNDPNYKVIYDIFEIETVQMQEVDTSVFHLSET